MRRPRMSRALALPLVYFAGTVLVHFGIACIVNGMTACGEGLALSLLPCSFLVTGGVALIVLWALECFEKL